MQSGKGVVHLTELESGDYKSICENLYDGIHITDGTGTILFINKAYTVQLEPTGGAVGAEGIGN